MLVSRRNHVGSTVYRAGRHAPSPGAAAQGRAASAAGRVHKRRRRQITISIRYRTPKLVQWGGSFLRRLSCVMSRWAQSVPIVRLVHVPARIGWGVMAIVLSSAVLVQTYNYYHSETSYELSPKASTLLGTTAPRFAQYLQFDVQNELYHYNKGYQPGVGARGLRPNPRFTATFNKLPEKGVTVTDPVAGTPISFRPLFKMAEPLHSGNRLMYPIVGKDAIKVYTLKAISLKEDVILNSYHGKTASFAYQLDLAEGTEARLEPNGSLGVYGVDLSLLGNVSTGGEKDAELLRKARMQGKKTNLLYTLPAPFVREYDQKAASQAKAWFELKGDVLTIRASDLDKAAYPLSIDPSIYIETAAKLMRGNNESNIDFDVDNELIKKGFTTGARFDQWNDTMDLNDGRWDMGTAVGGGYIYAVGGQKSDSVTTSYTASGSDTFNVPAGVTAVTVKLWGAGGGGGGGSTNGPGGVGGGGAYVQTTLTVTPSETLTIRVGGGGGEGDFSTGTSGSSSGDGGGGGGHSEIERSGTTLAIAAGGGGGGGGDNSSSTPGGAGGAGGGTTGVNGSASISAPGGGGGTQSGGGAGGVASASNTNDGASGGAELGGAGADGRNGDGADGSKNNGGVASGGDGGIADANSNGYGAGGGGGSGRYGGGGGSGSVAGNAGGGGGGGGSSYSSGSATTTIGGSGSAPGNNADPARGTAGEGGSGGSGTSSGTAGTDGRVIITYSLGVGSGPRDDVYWARLSTADNSIESPNPGNGSCTQWCTDAAYNLPEPLAGLSLVAYNGFLYAIGGVDDTGARSNYVYIAKLGANGEPQRWHPTDTNQNNWVYWWRDAGTNLSSERSYLAATAYNNRLYVLGGQTNASPGGITTVEYTELSPTGDIGTWSTTGMTALPSARHMHSVQVYNDYMYLIGGNSSGTLQSAVHYNKIDNDGTLNSWVATSSFATARSTWGGTFSVVWGGYIYLMVGCSALNGSGYCTTIRDDIQLASINADGTLGSFNTVQNVTNGRIGFSLVAWDNGLYRIGGCDEQNGTTGECDGLLADEGYAVINQDGDASTVSITEAPGSGNCTGGNPYDCDLPPTGDSAGQGGQMLSASAVMNGYLYVIGGCTNTACSGASGNVSYVSIGENGTLRRPSTCSGTTYGAWCVDSTNRVNGTTGVAAAGSVVFGGQMYVIGGLSGAGNVNAIYRNSVNDDGSLAGGWSSQSLTGAGATSVSYTFAYARANPASAGTNPGNLFIFGGCGTSSSAGCSGSDYRTEVYKCNIQTSGAIASCSTSGQMQIDSDPDTAGAQGLGIHSGTVYANYIYLIGGYSQTEADKNTVLYAKFDDSNNVVAVTGSTWVESPNTLAIGRRRGVAFGYNGYLYAVGGFENTSGTIIEDIEFAKINVSDGSVGTFSTSSVTINQRWGLSMVVSNSYAYVLGGCDEGPSPSGCTSFEPSVQTFQVYNNDSGTPASYSAGANLFATDRLGASASVVNGRVYLAGGCTNSTDCTDATSNVQYAALDEYGNLGSWTAATGSLPADRVWGQLEEAGGTLYYIGGQDDTATNEQSTVYYATPSSSTGDISSWSTASNGLPAARTQFGAAVWNDRIYVTGGKDSSGGETNTVYISPQLSAGGNITSAWTTDGDTFDIARSGHTLVSYANNLYILGGFDGANYLSDVQFTQINTDGSTDAWTFTTSLPEPIRQGDGFAANGYLYLFGGRSATMTCDSNTFVAPISANTTIATGNNPTGVGAWYETNEKYTGDRYGNAAVYHRGKAYVLGGGCLAATTTTLGTYTFDADGDSDESAWTWVSDNGPDGLNTSSTERSWAHDTNDTPSGGVGPTSGQGGNPDGYVYTESSSPAAAGDTFTTTLGTTLDASTYNWNVDFYWNQRGDDNLATVTVQTNEGSGWTTRGTYATGGPDVGTNGADVWNRKSLDLTGISSATTQVRFRVTLGSTGNIWNNDFGLDTITLTGTAAPTFTLTGANRVVQTTLLSQPQIAKYSRMIDTDSDVFPTKFLLNGVDNSIGARWQLAYRSSTAANSAWGQETDFGAVTLGNPEVYAPLDGSGVDSEFARYYYFSLNIDASQTFGYPDDVQRGPTINDLSLFFTADPNKRLMHGRTFTGGVQQPLDTPF